MVQAEEFQRRTRGLEKRELRLWIGPLLFMLAVLMGLTIVTARARSNQLPFILLGFIVVAVPVSLMLRKSRQDLNDARQRLIRETLLGGEVNSLDLLDPWTGLLNRRYLDSFAQKELSVADRTGLSLTFLMIAVQSFKSSKMVSGPGGADTFIVAVADLLRASFRNSDTLIRWGDREFLVLMLGCQEARSREVAERLLVKVDRWNREKAGQGNEMALTYTTAAYAKGTDITSLLDRLSQELMLQGKSLNDKSSG